MRNLLFAASLALTGCARNPTPSLAPLEQDRSIVFPESFGPMPIMGRPGKPYALEGVTLQALMIATNDFLSPIPKDTPCWSRRDAYVYQVLRQTDVIFIEIHADPAACEGQFLMLDSGVRYAISTDGRILRRLQSGEPEWPVVAPGASDAGGQGGTEILDVSSAVETSESGSFPPVGVDGGPPADAGT